MTKTQELQQESLGRAVHNQAITNYPAIFRGFMAKGISEDDIKPRVNVFTYNAWKALGRQVRKGEHGVKVVTFIETKGRDRDKDTGEQKTVRRPWTTTVFHVSQTEPAGAPIAHACEEVLDATAENVPYAGESVSEESLDEFAN